MALSGQWALAAGWLGSGFWLWLLAGLLNAKRIFIGRNLNPDIKVLTANDIYPPAPS